MTTKTTSPTRLHRLLRTGLLAAAATAIIGGASLAPALADPGWHGDRFAHERFAREHEFRAHERFVHRPYAYVAPVAPVYGYNYAPPVYAPPVYAAPSLSFTFPIR